MRSMLHERADRDDKVKEQETSMPDCGLAESRAAKIPDNTCWCHLLLPWRLHLLRWHHCRLGRQHCRRRMLRRHCHRRRCNSGGSRNVHTLRSPGGGIQAFTLEIVVDNQARRDLPQCLDQLRRHCRPHQMQ